MEILREAGLPDGVINFIPGPASKISDVVLASRELGGIHFTGSTDVFNHLWSEVSRNLTRYRTYPRLVGETGGKDFIVAHPSADLDALAVAIVRGGYEYQGQKCSAASRIYVPESLWKAGLRDRVLGMIGEISVGDVADFRNFMGAVIDEKSYDNISGYLAAAKAGPGMKIVSERAADRATGWFVPPTLVECEDPRAKTMQEEIFGPVVSLHVAPDAKWRETLALVDETSPYALKGAVFARDGQEGDRARARLRHEGGDG